MRQRTLGGRPLRAAPASALVAAGLPEGKTRAGRDADQDSPASLGFRLPAEWEPHEATWLGWPHNRTDWPGKFAPIPWVYGEIVRRIASGEMVRILVNSKAHEAQVRRILKRAGIGPACIEFFRFPTNRGWTRDFGPIFLRRDGPPAEVAVVHFHFNAWAKYPDWAKDNRVPALASRALGCPFFRARTGGRDFVLEGGSIDVNGRGTLLTTEECLLDPNTQVRNPGLSREETEETLRAYLGVANILWLGRGIAGDDTHGHVDDICRFVGPRTVVLCRERNPGDANYRPLEENRERLEGMRLEDGSRLQVVPLPMPGPLYFDRQRLPASYANFYIANPMVLVPTFNDPSDRVALGTLAELFPDRPVVGIHAVDLVWGLGTLHCLTREQPRYRVAQSFSLFRNSAAFSCQTKTRKRGQRPATARSAESRAPETLRLFAAAEVKAWKPFDQPDWLTQKVYWEKIQPRLSGITVPVLSSALGISQPYAAEIRAGRYLPHPRHWQTLAEIVRVCEN